ncbi:MAG: flippase [Flavobacteriales bacterium]|nr:flippase [Flavobacteriales bacterium]
MGIPTHIKKLIASSGVNFLFRILGLGFSFLITIVITRLFGIDNYGSYALTFTLAQALAMVFALGIPNALVKIIGNERLNWKQAKKVLLKGIKIVLIIGLIPFFTIILWHDLFSIHLFSKPHLSPYFLLLAIGLPIMILHELLLYFFIATQNFKKFNWFMFVMPHSIFLVFLLATSFLKWDGAYVFGCYVVAIIITVITEIFYVFELQPNQTPSILKSKQLLKISSPMMFSGLLIFLLSWTDTIMLGFYMSEADVGIYNVAFRLGSIGFLVIVSVSTFITPKISLLYGEKNFLELKRTIQNATRLVFLLSIPLFVVIFLGREFLLKLFGEEVVAGSNALALISVGILFSASCGNVDQILNMTGGEKILRNITLFSFVLNVILNFTFIPKQGLQGAALASLITNIVLNIACLFYVKKRLGYYTLI